ncbi:MAG: hypothetical protein QOE44_1802 [Solirubrobacteraceae bacterium]|nr:hypothetical protein [Solirubrobacteraceae bacterium]
MVGGGPVGRFEGLQAVLMGTMTFGNAPSRLGRLLSLVILACAVWLLAPASAFAGADPTTTTVTCPSATVGVADACSVTVTAPDGITPTGSVALARNSNGFFTPSATCTLTAGTCSFTYTPTAFGSGTHTVYANYTGDAAHAPSYGFVRFAVAFTTGRTTTTTLSCSPNPDLLLSKTTCTATVTDVAADPANQSAPTGTVSFGRNSLDASFDASSCTLAATGPTTAACSVGYTPSGVDTGMHKIYANYLGDAAHAVSHNSTVVTVQDVPPVASAVSFSGAVGNTVFGVGTSPAKPSTTASGSVLSNSSDQDGDPLTAVAATTTTTNGGTVVLAADGTFTYTPPAGFAGDDTFAFNVSDGALTSTTPGTATIHVVNRVWYVRNNAAGANDGRSISPFHTLGQAQTASSAGDYIYVFKGDGTSTGQSSGITLKANQHLIGETQDLVVAGVTLFTGNTANRPLITASSGNVVTLAGGTTVAGLAANPSGTANGIAGGAAGATINDVTIADSGSGEGVTLTNETGTVAITNTVVTGGGDDAVVITNSAGTLNLTMTGDTLAEPDTVSGNDALNITTTGSATVNPTISMTKFTAARGDLFQLNVGDTSSSTLSFTNNTLTNSNTNIVSGGGGVTITAGGGSAPAATLHFDIENNTFRDSLGNAIGIGNATGNNTISGKFSNNTVGVAGVTDSGSAQGGDLSVVGIDGGSLAVTAENNNFYQYNNAFGVNFAVGGTQSLDVKFDNNTVASPSGVNRATGLLVNAGTSTGSTDAVCFDGFANHLTGSGAAGNHDVLYRQRNSATVRLPGYGGSATTPSDVESFVQTQNPPSPDVLVTINSTGFTGGPTCATP